MDSPSRPKQGNDNDNNNGVPGQGVTRESAAEQALMNEDLEVSPVPPQLSTMQATGAPALYPGMASFPTDEFMQYGMFNPAGMGIQPLAMPQQQQQFPGMGGMMHGFPQMYSGPPPMQESDANSTHKRKIAEDEQQVMGMPSVGNTINGADLAQDAKRSRVGDDSTDGVYQQSSQGVYQADSISNGATLIGYAVPKLSKPTVAPAYNDIFADADDDVPIPLAASAPGNALAFSSGSAMAMTHSPPRANHQKQALSPSQRPDIRSIVLGSPSKVMVTAPKPAVVPKAAAVLSTPVPAAQPAKKKRKTKPQRKVLVARKEKIQARSLLLSSVDLLECLPKEDCVLLGEKLWVFTIRQLEWILTKSKEENTGDETSPSDVEARATARGLRQQICGALAASGVLGPSTVASGERAEEQPKPVETPAVASVPQQQQQPVDAMLPTLVETNEARQPLQSSMDKLPVVGVGDDTPMGAEAPSTELVGGEKAAMVPTATAGVALVGTGEVAQSTTATKDIGEETPQQDSSSSMAVAESAASVVVLDEGQQKVADAKLDTWLSLITTTEVTKPPEEQFPLDGPISCLFPAVDKNFLASIPVDALYEFLSLKKTESGATCDMFRIWRRQCNLTLLSTLILGRHLVSVAGRVESAVVSCPPVDARSRIWMSDPIMALTGAARDFLVVDQGIVLAAEFIDMRTKDLATKLEAWRERKGMPVLKGSGKVAMISQWKAGAKEALEAERHPGKILHDVDLEAIAAAEGPVIVEVKKDTKADRVTSFKPPAAKKKPVDSPQAIPAAVPSVPSSTVKASIREPLKLDRQFKFTLHSPSFLKDSLGSVDCRFLESIGINTAADLFDTCKKDIAQLHKSLIDTEQAKDSFACEVIIDAWCQRVNKELKFLQEKDRAARLPPTGPKAKSGYVRRNPFRKLADPYEGLSAVTQRFLGTINITSAEQFLTSRTTDMATEFVQFRIKESMPELKGLGAIASVSGWKAQVRKFAKELGQGEVADLEPTAKASWGREAREANKKENEKSGTGRRRASSKPAVPSIKSLSHAGALNGAPRRSFAVHDVSDLNRRYVFELSIRKLGEGKSAEVFATYVGSPVAKVDEGIASAPKTSLVQIAGATSTLSPSTAAVLSEAPLPRKNSGSDSRLSFKTLKRGCGLVELRKYGVRRLQSQNLSPLKREMKSFVLTGDVASGAEDPSKLEDANVLIHDGANGELQYLLYLETPLQKGQTIALRFPAVATLLKLTEFDGKASRSMHLARRALNAVAVQDLRLLQSFLETEVSEACGVKNALDSVNGDSIDQDTCERLTRLVQTRQRLRWLSLQAIAAGGDPRPKASPIFDWKVFVHDFKLLERLSKEQFLEVKRAVAAAVKQEVLAALDFDIVCGASQRVTWCRRASDLFHSLIETLVEQYCSTDVTLDQCSAALCVTFRSSYLAPLVLEDCTFRYQDETKSADETTEATSATSIQQAYVDSMALCGESPYEDVASVASGVLEKVACQGTRTTPEGSPVVVMRLRAEAQKDGVVMSEHWYRALQWQIVCALLSRSAEATSLSNEAWFDIDKIKLALREATNNMDVSRIVPEIPRTSSPILQLPAISDGFEGRTVEPHSLPFFVGVVWPILRKAGWRLDAGERPSDVTYFTPGLIGRKGMRAKVLKKERERKRAQLIRDTNGLGLGFVPKLTKRLFVAAVPAQKKDEPTEDTPMEDVSATAEAMVPAQKKDEPASILENATEDAPMEDVSATAEAVVPAQKKDEPASALENAAEEDTPMEDVSATADVHVSVSSAFERFLVHLESELGDSDQDVRDRAKRIVTGMKDCFDVVAPNLCGIKETLDQTPSDALGCDVLMQFLLVLPSVLRQASLPAREISDTLVAIQELSAFVASEYSELLDKRFHPPREHYVGQLPQRVGKSSLVSRLGQLRPVGQHTGAVSNPEDVITILLPSDKAQLTDYICSIFDQTVPCHATAEDTQKKNRNIEHGFPGLTCRHCLGGSGGGRYFFKTTESLSASVGILDKHFAKCPSVPSEVKSHIALCKRRHGEQRKHLQGGGQQDYFARLWGRMWSSGVAVGHVSTMYLPPKSEANTDTSTDSSKHGTESGNLGFTDHVSLLDFVRSTAPWKDDKAVKEALEQYYQCLEYGGRIYGTSAMPKNFNAEWLLSKVAPRQSRKRARMPG